ncbi:flavodoxin-dependent (E)-4-hydroxy-3-methylbut-2-enyl-diphosphate synthase [Klebsiella pneumoniae subsp. pneumoniae]|nr:flavodoxin-dependent (E)-4-hydroxy-3-methylbut-2-enyl-diphosphate synthase [Klebsiella pneumoniae subsp. pneumoniae]
MESYRLLAKQIDQPLHLRDHRSGRRAQRRGKIGDRSGTPAVQGIGDTLRVSLAADPVEEIKVGFDIPQISAYSFPRH